MLKVKDAIKMTSKEVEQLPRRWRRKAIESIAAYNAFLSDVEKLKKLKLSSNAELTFQSHSPAGMKMLPGTSFSYDNKTNQITIPDNYAIDIN